MSFNTMFVVSGAFMDVQAANNLHRMGQEGDRLYIFESKRPRISHSCLP